MKLHPEITEINNFTTQFISCCRGTMFVLELFLVGIVLIFIFLFNTMITLRNQVDRIRWQIEALLKRRRELAAALGVATDELEDAKEISQQLKLDAELSGRIETLSETDELIQRDFDECGSLLHENLRQYRSRAAAYNRALESPVFRLFGKSSKFKPREIF